jgi:uncharacterized protein
MSEVGSENFNSAYIFTTNRCNLACSYCYETERTGDMSNETMRNTIEWLISQRKPMRRAIPNQEISITFFGGEPLLNFPVVKYGMEYCKQKFAETGITFGIYILTNGTVLTDEMFEYFKEAKKWSGIVFHLQVSLDGCKESHDKYRVFSGSNGGSFDSIIRNIKRYREIFPHLIVRQTVVQPNIDRLYDDFSTLMSSGGVIANLTPVVEGDWSPEVINKFCLELERCVDYFIEYPGHEKMNFNYIHGTLLRMGDKKFNDKKGCQAGTSLVGVSVTGDIYPCHRFLSYRKSFDYKIGNVNDGGIDFSSDNWKKLLNMHASADRECAGCTVLTCNRCYATNIFMRNTPEKKPNNGYCEMCYATEKMLVKKLKKLVLERKIELHNGEILIMEDKKGIAINIGDGTEILENYDDVMARCLIKLVKEMQTMNCKIFAIEKHLGVHQDHPENKCNIKN